MRYVRAKEFVEALSSIGIEIPKNATRATIKLEAGATPVRIECEILVRAIEESTTVSQSTVDHVLSVERTTKRYKLVEDSDA